MRQLSLLISETTAQYAPNVFLNLKLTPSYAPNVFVNL